MTETSCLREFSRYTILSVLGTLGVSCYILADTFFISKGLGANGLTALNLAIPVYNFIHGTGLMLGMGGATRFTVCKSQGKDHLGNQVYMHTLYLGILFGAVFFLLGLFGSEPLAVMLGADAQVLELTDTYLEWLLLFGPAFIFNDIFLCFVRNDNSPQLSMMAMLIGSFANIVLDYIFIFPLDMGIFGAIFATGLSPLISISLMLPHWIRRKNTFHGCRALPKARIAGNVLALGVPSLIAQVSTGIVIITFNGIIMKLEGNTGVAAYGVIANIALVILAVYTGIAQGSQPLISRFHGKNNQKQIRKVLRYGMLTMVILSVLLYLFTFFLADPITAVFNTEGQVRLQQIAVKGLKLYFISNAFAGYNIILSIFFTSVEKAVPAQVLSILRGLILIIPIAFLLAAAFGMTGVWLAYPVTEGIVALLGWGICRVYWRKIRTGREDIRI